MGLFLDACEKGELREVDWFLKYYPHEWGCNRAGKTGLMYAAAAGMGAVMSRLLDEKYANAADVNARDKQGMTALLYAAEGGRHFAVAELLENNALPHPDKARATPLLLAALNGHGETLKVLLEKLPALVDTPDSAGMTPLWHAVAGGKQNLVRLLLDRGAKLGTAIGDRNLTGLATEHKHFDIRDMLREEPARRDAAISAQVDGGIAGGMKLRGPFTLVKKKTAEKIHRRDPAAEGRATLPKLQKPTFP